MREPTFQPRTLGVEHLENRLTPAVVDLTTHGSSGWVNDAFFQQFDARPTGTGKIDSFLRVQGASSKNVVQQGFNTSTRPLQFDENKSPNFTRDLLASGVPVVNIGGVNYREFLLDINQKSSQPYLSLDSLKVFVTDATTKAAGFDVTTGTLGGAAPAFDLDTGGDNWVKMDYRLNSGSGSGDVLVYIPDALFTGGDFVTVYSKFGEHFASNAGFQEWAVGKGVSVNSSQLGAIAGSVYFDANQSGLRDADETGFQDVTLYLDANNNGALDDGEVYDITDAGGYYKFEQLMAGVGTGYTVRVFNPPADHVQTTANPDTIFLNPGELRDHVDFGFYRGTPPS